MSDVPLELVEEILSRVPASSLKRFRFTCKRWNALVKDQRLSTKHFDRAAKQFLAYMWHENKFISLTVNVHDNNIAAPFIEFKGELDIVLKPFTERKNKFDLVDMFHCDGLLLFTNIKKDGLLLFTNIKKDRLVVWNPCTGEAKSIKPSEHDRTYSRFALGYGNNKNYKVLRYRRKVFFRSGVDFEIYEFSSGTWRVLEVTANFLIRSRGVSLKGNTYWLADGYNYLLCFDFSTERFVRLSLPFCRAVDTFCCAVALSIVREEKLSVLYQNLKTLKIEVWMATSDKIDETIDLSWKIFLVVDIFKAYGNLQLPSCLSFFIDEEKKLVVCCCNGNMVFVTGEYGVYKEIDLGEYVPKSGHAAVIFNYTPSLFQIQETKE